MEMAGVAGRVAQVVGQVGVRDLDFLQAQDVGAVLFHPGLQALRKAERMPLRFSDVMRSKAVLPIRRRPRMGPDHAWNLTDVWRVRRSAP